jgi:hypothetical protein
MSEPLNIEALLQTGYFKTSRAKSIPPYVTAIVSSWLDDPSNRLFCQDFAGPSHATPLSNRPVPSR